MYTASTWRTIVCPNEFPMSFVLNLVLQGIMIGLVHYLWAHLDPASWTAWVIANWPYRKTEPPEEPGNHVAPPRINIQSPNPRRTGLLVREPELEAIHGNAPPPALPRGLRSASTLTGLPKPLDHGKYRVFMLEYLAKRFGPVIPPTTTTAVETTVFQAGSRFEEMKKPDEHPEDPDILQDTAIPSSPEIWSNMMDPRDVAISDSLGRVNSMPLLQESGSRGNQPEQEQEQQQQQLQQLQQKQQQQKRKQQQQQQQRKKQRQQHPRPRSTIANIREPNHLTYSQVRNKLIPIQGWDSKLFSKLFPSCTEQFIPDAKIWAFLTQSRVRSILDFCDLETLDDDGKDLLAKDICGMPSHKADTDFISYRKILAILIIIGNEKHKQIRRFVDEKLDDGKLPLDNVGDKKNPYQLGLPDKRKIHCFDGWDYADIRAFERTQWELTAPFFKADAGGCQHYIFPAKIAMPFLPEDTEQAEGASATVMKVELPEEAGNLRTYRGKHPGKKQVFAIKKLHSPMRIPFEDESNILGRLNSIAKGHKTDHLSTLLATFEIGPAEQPSFYFIFPYADYNLMDFWKTFSTVECEVRVPRYSAWMARQFCGLARALEILHHFSEHRLTSDIDPRNRGIHGDIKPQNILFFKNWNGRDDDIGILQLADFGLAQYHHSVTVNQVSPLVRGAHPYCPPEVELLWMTNQSLDVWALGCLFLDFSVWLIYGSSGLAEFKKARTGKSLQQNMYTTMFYEIDRSWTLLFNTGLKISINKGVLEWIKKVHREPRTPKFIHDVVDTILNEVFVLQSHPAKAVAPVAQRKEGQDQEPPEGLFSRLFGVRSQPQKRIDISDLLKKLEDISNNDASYFEDPAPYDMGSFVEPASVSTSTTEAKIKQLSTIRTARRESNQRRLDEDLMRGVASMDNARHSEDFMGFHEGTIRAQTH